MKVKLRHFLRDPDQAIWSDDELDTASELALTWWNQVTPMTQRSVEDLGAWRTAVLWRALWQVLEGLSAHDVPVERLATYQQLHRLAAQEAEKAIVAKAMMIKRTRGLTQEWMVN